MLRIVEHTKAGRTHSLGDQADNLNHTINMLVAVRVLGHPLELFVTEQAGAVLDLPSESFRIVMEAMILGSVASDASAVYVPLTVVISDGKESATVGGSQGQIRSRFELLFTDAVIVAKRGFTHVEQSQPVHI